MVSASSAAKERVRGNYHADVVAVEQNLRQLGLSASVFAVAGISRVCKERSHSDGTHYSVTSSSTISMHRISERSGEEADGVALTHEVIKTQKGTAELCITISEWLVKEHGKRTLVPFHDDPDRGSHAAVNELQREKLRCHFDWESGVVVPQVVLEGTMYYFDANSSLHPIG